ncbi:mechanosensitive ion channel protein MscS [Thalassotalea insulae]|uniref:Small-conductance mechanosensitive channel n=1 Tax=Thalassotalea insulae TaxID=2056778 RepID=A0ABQ6GY73_9GAMM|nr:mechanosensitive ion channel family protein [Thalassotalea insulae]GLX79146.1 mechanosensitive ion channel protein MscS [Thalassotalea insulae]
MLADNKQSNIAEKTSTLLKDEIDQVTGFYQLIVDFFTNYSFQLVGAFIIFLIGYFVAGRFANMVLRLCEKQQLDVTLSRFLANTTKMLVVILVTIVALSKLGISVTPFIAAIGAISLGASLAFQGLLANYAAGFNIILIRPFVVGDTIEVHGVKGIVQEVLLAYTVIKDEDDVVITIPNKHIVGEILHNSKRHTLLEMSVGISYRDDPVKVIALIENTLEKLAFCDQDSKLQVGIDEFADSAITIGIRLWIPTSTLYQTKYQGYKAIYQAFKQHNITIPYPQRDVHLIPQ